MRYNARTTSTLWRLSGAAFTGGLLGILLAGVALSMQAQDASADDKHTRNLDDAISCKSNLTKIFEAIQEYRKKHKRMPNWLSDLHPEFIDDPKTFICPFVQKIEDFQSWKANFRGEVWEDPSLLTISYSYEFCAREYPLGLGVSTTVQEYKRRQMGLVGSGVPIVRCVAHEPVLNLSFGGPIYPSDREWENNFSEVVLHEDLTAEKLFAERLAASARAPRSFQKRDAAVDSRYLDLTDRYNATLTETWHPGNLGNNLVNLPQGIATFDRVGVQFDVRGLIQLKGKGLHAPFPEKVEQIKVGQKCRYLHFLHGTGFSAEDGTEIGHYEVHYAGGQKLTIPVVYGKDLSDWWCDPKEPKSGIAQIAWEGGNAATQSQGKQIRLYHSKWENPRKDVEITTISFVSAMTYSAPFLIAITVE